MRVMGGLFVLGVGMDFFAGMKLGLSLIVVIGAQNAFVLRQGILQRHVGPVVAFCALSDAALIGLGVALAGQLAANPLVMEALRYGGVAFLSYYAARSLVAALKGGGQVEAQGAGAGSLRAAFVTVAMLTWANPHVWLDTVVLLGAISAQFAEPWLFGAGAMSGSILFFTALGYGARYLAPVFARPAAWVVLDLLIAGLMGSLAYGLLMRP